MSRHLAIRCLLGLSAMTIGLIQGCSDKTTPAVPDTAVATVGQAIITKAEVQQAYNQFARTSGSTLEGQAQLSTFKAQIAEALIQREWFRREALRRHLEATPAEVRDALKADTGDAPQRDEDARAAVIKDKVVNSVMAKAKKLTIDELRAYFRAHKRHFGKRESRLVQVLAATSRKAADAARTALGTGVSWPAAIRQYGTDQVDQEPASGKQGTVRGTWLTRIEDQVFAGKRGEITKPLKISTTWYLFQTVNIDPFRYRPFDDSKTLVIGELERIKSLRALKLLTTDMSHRYRPITVCGEGLKLSECTNGPASSGQPQ